MCFNRASLFTYMNWEKKRKRKRWVGGVRDMEKDDSKKKMKMNIFVSSCFLSPFHHLQFYLSRLMLAISKHLYALIN